VTTFSVNTGAGWVTATPHRWDGSGWAQVGGGSVIVPDPPAGPLYRQIASRTGVSTYADQATSGGRTGKTNRIRHIVTQAGTDPKVSFNNVNGQTVGLSAITVGAAIEIGGTVYPFTFGGAAKKTLQPGESVTSDPLTGVTVPTGAVFTRTWIDLPSSANSFPRSWGIYLSSGVGEGTTRTTTGADLTLTGSGAVPVGSDNGTPPLALSAVVPSNALPAIAIIGDSITEAQLDDWQADPTHSGYAVRAVTAAGRPYITYARGGDKAQLMNSATRRAYWFEALDTCTHAITGYAINDIAGSRTLAQLQADNLSLWTYLVSRGVTPRQVTCTPYTTSTDAWATLANQTVRAQESVRLAWNAWLRDGAPISGGVAVATGTSGALRAGAAGHPLNGVLDTAATVETDGKWNVGATTEGLHPSPAGMASMSAPVQTWVASLS
jgi:hypothetical protein